MPYKPLTWYLWCFWNLKSKILKWTILLTWGLAWYYLLLPKHINQLSPIQFRVILFETFLFSPCLHWHSIWISLASKSVAEWGIKLVTKWPTSIRDAGRSDFTTYGITCSLEASITLIPLYSTQTSVASLSFSQ